MQRTSAVSIPIRPSTTPLRITRRACLLSTLALAGPLAAVARPAVSGDTLEWPPLRLLDGSVLAPSAWQDTAAVLVFWHTTCPFCKRQNAHVDKLFRSLGRRPLRVLGVALDQDETTVQRYLQDNRYGFAVTMDAARLRDRIAMRNVIPTTCLVDRNARLLQTIPGEMFEEDVMELVSVVVAETG
jgi:hypothetical protein